MLRTHTCSDLNSKNIGEKVILCGWIQKSRDLGGMTFIDFVKKGIFQGIASIYNPYDHIRQTAFEYKEIPLVLMDAHLNPISIVEDYKNLFLNWIGKVKTFNVAVDWHQRGASPDYSWIDSYKTLCQMYRSLSEN